MSDKNKTEADRQFSDAMAARDRGDSKCAARLLERAIELDDRHAAAHEQLGWLKYGFDEDQEGARALLEKAIDLAPSSIDARMYLALVLGRLGEAKRGEGLLREALRMEPDNARLLAVLGEQLACRGRYDQAKESLERSMRLDPQLDMAKRDCARVHAALGDDEKAELFFRDLMERDPNDGWTNYRFGEFLAGRSGRDEEAEKYLRRAIELHPDSDSAKADLRKLLLPRQNRVGQMSWDMEVGEGWESYDSDAGVVVLPASKDSHLVLRSLHRRDGDLDDADLRSYAKELAEITEGLSAVAHGDFVGFYGEQPTESHRGRDWLLRAGRVFLHVKYFCPIDVGQRDDEAIDSMLDTLVRVVNEFS